MLIVGVEVLVVDFNGRARFRPQSPLLREESVVSMAAWVGYGRVEVSDSKFAVAVRSELGRGKGGGKEKSLEVLRRLAVGDSLLIDILRTSRSKYFAWSCDPHEHQVVKTQSLRARAVAR